MRKLWRTTLRSWLLAAAVLLVPGAAAANYSFWYGDDMPENPGLPLHEFLTAPNGPLHVFQEQFFTFTNHGPTETGVRVYNKGRAWNGYTLLSAIGAMGTGTGPTILIDMEGRVVKHWPLFPFPAKMLPGGYVLGGGSSGKPGHQEMGSLVQMDWCGNPVWAWAPVTGECVVSGRPVPCARWHHDYQRQGSPVGYYSPFQPPWPVGKTLVLTHFNPDPALVTHITDNPEGLEDDQFVEVDPQGNVLWSWRAWEHIEEMKFDPVARAAIRTNTVGAPEGIGGGFTGSDWQHINSMSYVGPNKWYDQGDLRFHPDNIIWDGRSSNIIAIVARHDHPDGKWREGEIVWQIGPDYGPGSKDHRIGQIIGQHHAHIIPKGLPGAGNLLVFDNGGLAGFGSLFPGTPPYWPVTWRSNSRVIEIDPVTRQIVWEYEHVKPDDKGRKFFSWFISSAQRLLNGNTLITEGSTGRVFEVTRKGRIVWEYISPYVTPGSDFGPAVYRAYRIPHWWLPWDKSCPPPAQ